MEPKPIRMPRQRRHTPGRITRQRWTTAAEDIAESLAESGDMSAISDTVGTVTGVAR